MIICNRRRKEKHKQHKECEIIEKMLRNWSHRKREVKENEEKKNENQIYGKKKVKWIKSEVEKPRKNISAVEK